MELRIVSLRPVCALAIGAVCLLAGEARADPRPRPGRVPAPAARGEGTDLASPDAHGGQYRGPSDVKPPADAAQRSSGGGGAGAGAGGGGTGGANAPAAGSASSGSAGLPTGLAPSQGPRGVALSDDLGRWEFWWEFGKDPYLRLRDAIYGPSDVPTDDALLGRRLVLPHRRIERPGPDDLQRVADALAATLGEARDRDTLSGSMVALAKIGRDGAGWTLHDRVAPFLASGDQELRETAALALGIAGLGAKPTIDLLLGLVQDSARGRAASGDAAVAERTRAFAAYALGLLLARDADAATTHRIVSALIAIVDAAEQHGRDLVVAAIAALSLYPRAHASPRALAIRATIVSRLEAYYLLPLGPGERLLQAHVPTAVARLLSPADPAAATWRQRLRRELATSIDTPAARAAVGGSLFVAQSCALALGDLTPPWDDDASTEGRASGELLLRVYALHRDAQTRSFALLSLARSGGAAARGHLLACLRQANRGIEQPWCAMALGLLRARERERAIAGGGTVAPDELVATSLAAAFDAARNPSAIGALGIALGLAGDLGSADRLRRALREHRHQDEVAGYLALALGLMRDPRAAADLRELRRDAHRRPFVLMQAVRALGLLGDAAIADELCVELGQGEPTLMRLSALASALGQIGDRRSIDPLLRMLGDPRLTPLTRAFATVALGSIGDKDALPWNAAYATTVNYRAATETLTDGASGILDIL